MSDDLEGPMHEPNLPDLAEVLAEVNRLRAEREMEPLDEMPKGTHSGWSCPLARAFGATDGETKVVYADARGAVSVPGHLFGPTWKFRMFVSAFDAGRYPELELEAAE
jgi:hypothetical protein